MTIRKTAAFTLVELSIVLVIIALLVGGIVVGREMVHASELRSIITEVERYKTAVNNFRIVYNCLPGDCTNATQIWGAASSNPATCPTTLGTGTQTCDGNGNGHVDDNYYTTSNEIHRFWQQLSNAQLINNNTLTGISTTPCSAAAICTMVGVNIPASRYPSAGYDIVYLVQSNPVFSQTNFHALVLGANRPNYSANYPILAPMDSFSLDTKIDDGLPGMGTVMTIPIGIAPWAGCTSTLTPSATYVTTNSAVTCAMLFRMPF